MKKLFFFSAFALFCTFHASAQTKRIAHYSHSGSSNSFSMKGDGNFGLSPEMEKAMRHYSDSISKADIAQRADSLKKQGQTPKPQDDFGKPKETANISKAANYMGRAKRS